MLHYVVIATTHSRSVLINLINLLVLLHKHDGRGKQAWKQEQQSCCCCWHWLPRWLQSAPDVVRSLRALEQTKKLRRFGMGNLKISLWDLCWRHPKQQIFGENHWRWFGLKACTFITLWVGQSYFTTHFCVYPREWRHCALLAGGLYNACLQTTTKQTKFQTKPTILR